MDTPQTTPPVSEEELAELRALKASQTPEPSSTPAPEPEPAPETAPEPEPWPHTTIELAGETLEVRKPSREALVAFSMSNEGLDSTMQLRVLRALLQEHMSAESYFRTLTLMVNPDVEFSLNGLIAALMELPDPE